LKKLLPKLFPLSHFTELEMTSLEIHIYWLEQESQLI
jgi:hypothetical protein